MADAFIVDAVRTPIGRFGGALSGVRADTLASIPLRALLERNPTVPPELIEEVLLGCANQAGEDNRNIARMSLLLAGFPVTVAGETVNRLCASGLSAVISAHRGISSGCGDFYVAGGVEQMTRSPYVLAKSSGPFDRTQQLFDTTLGWRFVNPEFEQRWGVDSMGETAENLVDRYHITREAQDQFAYWSQQKAARALSNDRFAQEIVSVEISGSTSLGNRFSTDETPRPTTSMEGLAKLKPVFRDNGTVTAGTASPLADGACALLLASDSAVQRFALSPKARIIGVGSVGVEPRIMGIGPVEASRRALERAKLTLDQIDVVEINEAFAAQTLSCLKLLGIEANDPRVNPNGGAIALGHPLGMSGARLCQSAVVELTNTNKRYALVTLCVGVGQGLAIVLERTT